MRPPEPGGGPARAALRRGAARARPVSARAAMARPPRQRLSRRLVRRAPRRTASGARCAWRAGCTAAATTAAWCSSTCATAPGWCRWCSTRRRLRRRTRSAHALRSEWVISVRGEVVRRSEETDQPRSADRRDRGAGERRRGARRGAHPALPARRGDRGGRGAAAALPLPGPAPRADAASDGAAPRRGDARFAATSTTAGLPRVGDADPDPVHARGRARLHRAEPHAARQLLRAAAVAAAVQAAPDGRRLRALLPDRALLPRRGPARRPPAGVHPARPRDVVRGGGRRDRASRRGSSRRRSRPPASSCEPPFPRCRTTRRSRASAPTAPTRGSAWRSDDLGAALGGHGVQGLPRRAGGRRGGARHQRRRARAVPRRARPPDRVRPGAGRRRPGLGLRRGGRRVLALAGGEVPRRAGDRGHDRRARGRARRPAAAGGRRRGHRLAGAGRAAARAGRSASAWRGRANGTWSGWSTSR